MRQLEKILGDNDFKTGVQTYIERFANSNADWNDLIDIFDQKTSLNIKKWSEVWVNSAGRPLFTDQLVYDENNKIKKVLIYPKKSKAINLAFDITPAKYVTGLITERGISEASSYSLKQLFKK